MPTVKLSSLGAVGIINDPPPFGDTVPPNAFTDGQNVRAYHGRMRNFGGWELVTTAPIEPYGLVDLQTPDRTTLWLEGGLTKVYVFDGSNHINVTRQTAAVDVDYTMNEYNDRWTGGSQGTLAFLCNGADGPQLWPTISTANKLEDMEYDPQGSAGNQTWQELGYVAYAMRAYSSTILALNTNLAGTALTSRVQWCDFIQPGDTTTDWVERTTNSAGHKDLGDTSGAIIDGGPLRDDFIIYKEDAGHRMSFTGDANAPFIFSRLPEYVRVINRNCIGVSEEFHVLASREDVKIFDGNTYTSILDKRMREYYTGLMDPDRLLTTFVAMLNKEKEAWICFPTVGDVGELKFPDRAIVWNSNDNTISLTDLPQCRDMDEGVIVPNIPDRFDDTTPVDLIFNQDTLRFDQSPFTSALEFMVGCYGDSVATFGEVPGEEGKPRMCRAERLGIILQDSKTGITSVDANCRLGTIRLYMQSTGTVKVQLGGQQQPNGAICWEPEQTFDPTQQSHLTFRACGKYAGYRVTSDALIDWEITAVEIDYEPRSRR